MEKIQEKFVVIDGIRLSYLEKITDETKPITFFLHGWGSNKESFSLLYPHIENVIAIDFPSHGSSQHPKTAYDLDDFVRITNLFFLKKIDSLKTVGNNECEVVVHSFGGRVLLKWMTSYPLKNRFSKITCIGVPFYRDLTLAKKIQMQVSSVLNVPVLLWAKPVFQKMYSIVFPSADWSALQGNEVLKKTYQNIVSEETAQYLPVLQNENVRFIWGENDDAAPVSNMTRASEIVQNAVLYSVKDAGHFPWIDQKVRFFKVFLKK